MADHVRSRRDLTRFGTIEPCQSAKKQQANEALPTQSPATALVDAIPGKSDAAPPSAGGGWQRWGFTGALASGR
jgi:hypothetical protein